MERFEIEKGVVIPRSSAIYPKMPFDEMEVGDSFLIGYKLMSADEDPDKKAIENWRAQVYCRKKEYAKKKKGFKLETRKVNGGLRVWRMA